MTAVGAIIGLILAILLIINKISPFYSMLVGALLGGIIGGLPLDMTVKYMVDGVKDITPAIVRILAAGVLSGVLIKTGAASSIANGIIKGLGEKNTLFALAFSTMLLTAIGVFIDVAVITVAPIALAVGFRSSHPKMKLLLAMIGGGKAGNIISPNPNTIISAENFHADLSSVMMANLVPAIIGLFATVLIVKLLPNKGERVLELDRTNDQSLPSFFSSISGPLVTIFLLALRPLCGVVIDPLIALPLGGICGIIVMRKLSIFRESIAYGLEKMSVVAVLLVGTGTLAGIIKYSSLKEVILSVLAHLNMGSIFIAPVSGALMSAATASTTAGATVASASFAQVILAAGISGVLGAAMVNAGATILDHLPHGSFFHATAGATTVNLKERLKLIPYESLIGFVLTAASVGWALLVS